MTRPADIPQWLETKVATLCHELPLITAGRFTEQSTQKLLRSALLAAYERGRGEQREAVKTLEQIVLIDRREKRTCVDVDPAGNTYAVEMVDGPCAKVARLTLNSLKAST